MHAGRYPNQRRSPCCCSRLHPLPPLSFAIHFFSPYSLRFFSSLTSRLICTSRTLHRFSLSNFFNFFLLQLVSDDENGNMRALPLTEDTPPLIEDSQAVLEDYTDAVEYRRGPLNPDLHQSEPDDKSSTYTLTNVVPLIPNFLDTSWNPYLDIIRRRLNNFCHGKSFVVTGVTVSGAAIQRENRDRLAIPKHLWLAYCCPRFDRNSPYEVRFMFPSYGGYALNGQTDQSVVEVPLKTLESFLKSKTDIDSDLTIFYKGCVSENTFKKKRDLTSVSV